MTELAERMRLFTPGQITWPEPEIGQRCSTCAHAEEAGRGKIRCGLVGSRHKAKGLAFDGHRATACPQYKFGGAKA